MHTYIDMQVYTHHVHAGHGSKPNSLRCRKRSQNQKTLPVVGFMKMKVKNILKHIKKNDQTPITSDEFPWVKGHHGLCYEMRFFTSNFGNQGNCSLYIDVARSYLHNKAKNKKHHKTIEVPAMNITVTMSLYHYGGESATSEDGRGHEIKREMLETNMKQINSQGEASKTCVVASFPQLVSHAELGLPNAITEGRSTLDICVEMSPT